jgi:hypothetical protein
MSPRLKRIQSLLHRAVDWVIWSEEEPERDVEAIRRLRRIAIQLCALTGRGQVRRLRVWLRAKRKLRGRS